jgi:cytochrome P450
LRDDPSKINKAVEEMLRFANRDIDIGGYPVKKGESFSTSLAATNRDPDLCKSDKGHTYQ